MAHKKPAALKEARELIKEMQVLLRQVPESHSSFSHKLNRERMERLSELSRRLSSRLRGLLRTAKDISPAPTPYPKPTTDEENRTSAVRAKALKHTFFLDPQGQSKKSGSWSSGKHGR